MHRLCLWLASQALAQVSGTPPVCSSIDSWLSTGPTSPREKALFLYAEMTANLPHTRKLLHSPRHPLLAYSELACQGCWQGLLFWALKRCLLNGHLVVYTFFLPYYRSTFTRSPVSVSSLLETFSGPAQDCSVLVNRGGLWEEVWEAKPSGTPGPPLDLNHPTTRGPHRPPGTLSAH